MKLPDFSEEGQLWKRGFKAVAGVDEVGRGAWVGPVVAGAVAFAPQIKNLGMRIDDSKRLKPRERETADEFIRRHALAWGIGEVGPAIINRIGMARATKMAFRKAIKYCAQRLEIGDQRIDFLLLDAFYIPYVRGLRRKHQKAIVKGDTKVISIAAASIIAKVYRDKLMGGWSKKHPEYKWAKNKGYGTREHQEAILKYGITRLHRKGFVETWFNKLKTQNSFLDLSSII